MPFAAATEPDTAATRLAARTFISSAVHAPGPVVRSVLPYVGDADLDHPGASILAAIRTAVTGSPTTYGVTAVLDVLLRGGSRPEVRKALLDAAATTTPCHEAALREFGAMVVSLARRRQLESLGHALIAAAADGPEADLGAMVDTAVTAIKSTEARLLALRGETP